MHVHRSSNLANCRGELTATTSKREAFVVIAEGESTSSLLHVIYLVDKRGNNSLFRIHQANRISNKGEIR